MKSLFILSLLFFSNLSLAEKPLFCDKSNYQDFIYNQIKTDALIEQTGQGCQLEGILLIKVSLQYAYFKKANLSGADLYGADLLKANLSGANLSNTQLVRAELVNATLFNAQLHNTDFSFADLRDVDLRETDLNQANLIGAIYNNGTNFLSGPDWSFNPKERGMRSLTPPP